MGRKVIFLDFDGVIRPIIPHHRKNKQFLNHDFCGVSCYCVRMLCQIPDTEIVLTTSWRLFYPLDKLIAMLNPYRIGCYIKDKTSIGYSDRSYEIQAYLNEHTNIDHYLIIDDINMERFFPDHMLHCHDYLHVSQFHKGYEILMKE